MLVAERLQKIVRLVNERGSVRVTELSELCNVTEETIRRDLDKLEGEGKLMRSHGGAVSVKESSRDLPYFVREATNMEQKRRIAEEAVNHIEANDRIVLDASTTAWCMAGLLPDMPLTVLTNSIKVATELSAKENIQVISTGGMLSPGSLSFIGPLAEKSLDAYHVNKAFLSCKGAHADWGISESNEWQAWVKQKMMSVADTVYVLADYSKFGIRSFIQVATWERIDTVITDAGADEDMLNKVRDMGVRIIRK